MNESKRGKLTSDEVSARARKIFDEISGLNAWDRRRVLQKVERMNRENRVLQAA